MKRLPCGTESSPPLAWCHSDEDEDEDEDDDDDDVDDDDDDAFSTLRCAEPYHEGSPLL